MTNYIGNAAALMRISAACGKSYGIQIGRRLMLLSPVLYGVSAGLLVVGAILLAFMVYGAYGDFLDALRCIDGGCILKSAFVFDGGMT